MTTTVLGLPGMPDSSWSNFLYLIQFWEKNVKIATLLGKSRIPYWGNRQCVQSLSLHFSVHMG